MKILIIGSGGREHALAWKVAQSNHVSIVWVAPGNEGTAAQAKTKNIAIPVTDCIALREFALREKIDLTIVGPEAALAAGIADVFHDAGLAIFAPTKAAAMLEISKDYCKDFLITHNIPTAAYRSFTDIELAIAYLKQHALPVVIKADGLAAGKGVVITDDLTTAITTVTDMLNGNSFGTAGACVVIEEFLTGTEMSYIVMVDGDHVLPLASSKDHKRRDNGDQGPNTGGMGAISPSPLLTPELERTILDTIIYPTVLGMKKNGTPYTGFLYAGLMIDAQHNPKVLEFNCRLGDPETQALLPRLESDLAYLCLQATQKKLHDTSIAWYSETAITIVMASAGYPDHYTTGHSIRGLDANLDNNVTVFLSGVALRHNELVTQGGRVLSVTALGETTEIAYNKAYTAVKKITWDGCYYRTDIGQ